MIAECSNSASERLIRFVRGLAQDGRYGQEQPCKQSVKALAGDTQYSKGNEGHQKVAQDEAVHHATARGRGPGLESEVGQAGNHFFQPVKVQIGNASAQGESQCDAPAEKRDGGEKSSDTDDEHEDTNAVDGTGVEVIVRLGLNMHSVRF